MKKTWAQRERQFYGEEFEDAQGTIKEDEADEETSSDEDLARSNQVQHLATGGVTQSMIDGLLAAEEDEEMDEIEL